MVDLKLKIDEDGADLVLEGGDLALDLGLESAVLVSLFSDGRVDPPLAAVDGERRGYWSDTLEDRWGSLMWTVDREAVRPQVLARLQETAGRALQWMIEDGIGERIQASAGRQGREVATLEVGIVRGSAPRWARLWDSIREPTTVELDGMSLRLLPL